MKYLAVKNFQRFQHYRDRNPLWIKLYASVLHDPAFIRLPEVAQAQLVKLWVLASQAGNPLPNDPKYLARAIGSGRLQLPALIAAGFLIPTDDASSALAEREQDASKMSAAPRAREEGEAEGETERETEQPPRPPREATDAEARVAGRLTTDADRNALTALLVRVPHAETWLAEMSVALDGMPGHVHVTAVQLGEAIREYVGNGAATNPNLRQFRRYLEQAARPALHVERGASRPRVSPGAQQVANILGVRR